MKKTPGWYGAGADFVVAKRAGVLYTPALFAEVLKFLWLLSGFTKSCKQQPGCY